RLKTGAPLIHVPYRSGSAAMSDLVSGETDLAFTTISAARSYIEQGLAVAVATTGKERSDEYPDTPTLYEFIDGFEVYFWTALFVPKGTPSTIIEKLTALSHEVLNQEKVRSALQQGGNTAMPLSAKDTAAFIDNEAAMWKEVIEQSGVKAVSKS